VLFVIGLFFTFWKRSSAVEKERIQGTQNPALHGPLALFNDKILRTRLPEPYGVLQWNFLHANVLQVGNTTVLEILAFIPCKGQRISSHVFQKT
jgi:hypothetical protein